MSTTSPLLCLFCQHSNLPDALFCSVCDAQLDLQPCEQCGAVDSREAKKCYKCGSEFATVAQSGFGAESAPVGFGDSFMGPPQKDTSVTRLMTTRPIFESMHSVTELQPITVGRPSDMGRAASRLDRRWLYFGVPLLLSLMAVSTYVMRIEPEKLPQQMQPTQGLTAVSKASALSTVAPPPESEVKAIEIESTPPVGVDPPKRLSSPAPTNARAAPTKRSAPAAVQASAPPRTSQPLKDCPKEVATLGLCNPETN